MRFLRSAWWLTPLWPPFDKSSGGQRGVSGWLGALILAATAFLCATPALAGDTASLNVLGYSPDGKVFAFEEYGVLDGSGSAYSDIYFIDTESDKFLPGTPIRMQEKNEGGDSLANIRAQTHEKAEALISRYRLADDPGVMVAYNPISEASSDPFKVRYYEYISSPPRSQTDTLELKPKEFPPSADCLNMTGNYTGFTLTLTEYQGAPTNVVVHEDKQVPKSRGCPNGYRIGAVITSENRGPQIAMILVDTFGFEGNDQRWMAVPVNPDGK
jgi:predicted secreted protein